MSSDKKIYSEEFMQKSWDQMHTILNKEIPEKENKKPFFLFLFGMFALGLVIALSYYNMSDELVPSSTTVENSYVKIETPTSIEKQIQDNKTVTKIAAPETANTERKLAINRKVDLDKKTKVAISYNTEASSNIYAQNNTQRESNTIAESISSNTIYNENFDRNTSNTKMINSVNQNNNRLIEEPAHQIVQQNSKSDLTYNRENENLQFTEQAPLAILNNNLLFPERTFTKLPSHNRVESIEPVVVTQNKTNRFSLGLSRMTNLNGGVTGANMDIAYQLPLSSKLSLVAGVGSSYFNFSNDIYRVDPDIDEETIRAIELGNSLDLTEFSEDMIEVPVDSLLSIFNNIPNSLDLHLALGMSYQLHDRINLGAGARYRRFFNASSLSNSEDLDVALPTTGQNSHDENNSLSAFNTNNYNRSFLNPYFSVEYRFANKLSITAEYEYFLTDFTNTERSYILGKNNSMVALGIKYSF
jgi:opacity protein-like surface antigen